MARTSDRIIAGIGAAVFFVSISAFTVFVVYDMLKGGKTSNQTNKSANAEAEKMVACQQAAGKADVLAVPEAFVPGSDVTQLESTDLEVGSGASAKKGDCLIMKYNGTLAADGTKFDGNYDKDNSFSFILGGGQVIKGWDEGLSGMKVGGTRRLIIPSDKAYGETGQGAIPANSDLVFTVKLLKIQ